jgi:hypothetical protein
LFVAIKSTWRVPVKASATPAIPWKKEKKREKKKRSYSPFVYSLPPQDADYTRRLTDATNSIFMSLVAKKRVIDATAKGERNAVASSITTRTATRSTAIAARAATRAATAAATIKVVVVAAGETASMIQGVIA